MNKAGCSTLRRGLIIGVLCLASALSASAAKKPLREPQNRPNIVLIYTDQQHANMMSCAGNPYVKTPAMDYLAENGMRFTRAYTANPVCVPARISMMTGRFPSEFRDNTGGIVRENSGGMHRFGGASEAGAGASRVAQQTAG